MLVFENLQIVILNNVACFLIDTSIFYLIIIALRVPTEVLKLQFHYLPSKRKSSLAFEELNWSYGKHYQNSEIRARARIFNHN